VKKRLLRLLKDGQTAAFASLTSSSKEFRANERGAIAIVAAVALPVAMGMIALAVEFGHGLLVRDEMQRVADEAAYAGALAYAATNDQTRMQSAAQNVAVLNGVAGTAVTASLVTSPRTATNHAVQATVAAEEPIVFGQILGFGGSLAVQSTSYAEIPTNTPPCILALSSSGQGVSLSGGTHVSAPSCVVASQASLVVPCGTYMTAKSIQYNGVAPTVGCSGITGTIKKVSTPDPLAGNTAIVAANARAIANETLAAPTIPSAPSGGPTPSFGWSSTPAPSLPTGCSASWSSPTWTVSCAAGGTYNFGSLKVPGGMSIVFRTLLWR
jgi:Flp pilus assembly protein TadG